MILTFFPHKKNFGKRKIKTEKNLCFSASNTARQSYLKPITYPKEYVGYYNELKNGHIGRRILPY